MPAAPPLQRTHRVTDLKIFAGWHETHLRALRAVRRAPRAVGTPSWRPRMLPDLMARPQDIRKSPYGGPGTYFVGEKDEWVVRSDSLRRTPSGLHQEYALLVS